MTTSVDRKDGATTAAPSAAVDVLLSFGAAMMRAGNTAVRTREWMEVIAHKLGFDVVQVSLSLDSITASVRHAGEWMTAMREIGPPGINAWRIAELEQLARAVGAGLTPREIAAKLAEIETTPPRYSRAELVSAIALASGAFAFLNGAAAREMIAAAIGGGVGQCFRAWLAGRQHNPYGVASLTAIVASGTYVLAAALAGHLGYGFARYPAGFIASVLFLVPGFPLIAALFDLLQNQTVAAVSRFAYGLMVLLAVALGLSIVIAVAGVSLSRQPPIEIAYPLKLVLRAVASFIAAGAFAMLFNGPMRTVMAAGVLAVAANGLRLVLSDMGMMLAPAAFIAAMVIGIAAVLLDRRFDVPRVAIVVAPTIIMIPGLFAFEMIVLFNHGQMLEALQASAVFGFVIGALALGLATVRLFSRPR